MAANAQPTRAAGPTQNEVDVNKREHLTALGDALGLDPQFTRQVAMQGQAAIIDRTIQVDKNGAHTRLMALVQRFAMMIEEGMIRQHPISSDQMLESVQQMAEQLDIQPILATEIVGLVMDVYQQAARHLSIKQGEEEL